jgi:hypothetical protein
MPIGCARRNGIWHTPAALLRVAIMNEGNLFIRQALAEGIPLD